MKIVRATALIAGAVAGIGAAFRTLREPAGVASARKAPLGAAIFALTIADWLILAAGMGFILALGGFLVAASGIVPIKASSGHWPVTEWLLHFSMKRSISTHTMGLHAPALDQSWMVLKGAGHYQTGCRPCHGSPELKEPQITHAMTPHPPYLPPRLSGWSREELFYIVKHGVKFTGMPAWPSLKRDDEVWAIVAFLEVFPRLDSTEYMRLTQGNSGIPTPEEHLTGLAGPPVSVSQNCARCHGLDGLGRGEPAFPKLAVQSSAYLANSLQAYGNGKRHSGMMEPIAAALGSEQIQEIATWYSRQPAGAASAKSDPAAVERGRAIADGTLQRKRIPACSSCHGPKAGPRNPNYPVLAGQHAEYLELQLELFSREQRGGTPYAHLMHDVTLWLTRDEMRDVAAYYASLTPERATAESP